MIETMRRIFAPRDDADRALVAATIEQGPKIAPNAVVRDYPQANAVTRD